jgi:hypothetical protein
MPDIFGTPEGSIAAQKQQQEAAMFGLSYAEEAQKVQVGAIQLAQQQKMLQMLQQRAVGQPGQPSSNDALDSSIEEMYSMAGMYEATGQLDKAGKLFSQASTMRHNQADIESKRLTESMKAFNTMSSLMDGVTDQASWQRANATYELATGQKSPYAQLPYSPRVVEKIKAGIASAKDRAATKAAEARTRDSDAAALEHKARIPLIAAQTQLTKDRDAAITKAGGKALLPNAQDISAVKEILGAKFGADPLDPETQMVARQIAERKKELQVNEQLSPAEAAARAVKEAHEAGLLRGINTNLGNINRPMALPPDPKKLKVNKWYSTPKGRMLFDGKQFLSPAEVPGSKVDRSVGPEGDEEDDDDAE